MGRGEAYRVLIEKSEVVRPIGRPRCLRGIIINSTSGCGILGYGLDRAG